MKLFFLACLLGLLYACDTTPTTSTTPTTTTFPSIQTGDWRATLNINTVDSPLLLPFNIQVVAKAAPNQLPTLIIQNGEETIEITEIVQDSSNPKAFVFDLPVFNATITASLDENTLVGQWNNYAKKDYSLPFRAEHNSTKRFLETTAPTTPFAKRWKVMFSPNTPDAYPAVGLFEVESNGRTTGTFLTETGDYRFLEGHFDGQFLQLSCFDGAHAFLFNATLNEAGELHGRFWSGSHWKEAWMATPSEEFQLADMQSLTYLKEGYEQLEFAFPDMTGDTVVYDSSVFKNQVTIVQISGSWCPNCMDASRFFGQLYQSYQSKGLEIVAIDYELQNSFELFKTNESKLRRDLKIDYPVLFGGLANKKEASKTLPMLNHILSYPTAIFVDKKGKVRAIHTGFSGPGTGDIYRKYIRETEAFIQQLLAEE
ncbi:MAG: TlpA family protein disulfide reductase [Aureispira sp.]